MVPSFIRRDPLRLPPYCVRQMQPRTNSLALAIEADTYEQPLTANASNIAIAHNSSSQRSDDTNSPEFYIRGVVIGGKLKAESSIDDDPYQPIDSRHQQQQRQKQRYCDATWRRRSREGETGDCADDDDEDDDDNDDGDENEQRMDCDHIDELLMLNMDGYEMDRFGHLPGNSRTPTPMRRRGWTPDINMYRGTNTPRRRLRTNTAPPRIPSPTTEQIIRILLSK